MAHYTVSRNLKESESVGPVLGVTS